MKYFRRGDNLIDFFSYIISMVTESYEERKWDVTLMSHIAFEKSFFIIQELLLQKGSYNLLTLNFFW